MKPNDRFTMLRVFLRDEFGWRAEMTTEGRVIVADPQGYSSPQRFSSLQWAIDSFVHAMPDRLRAKLS